MEKGTTLQKVDTVLNADAAEWCPYGGQQDILLCGTYKLLEPPCSHQAEDNSQSTGESNSESSTGGQVRLENTPGSTQVRLGGVITYRLQFSDSGKPCLKECGQVSMSGVLDIKWPEKELGHKFVYGVVDAEGQFQLFQLHEEDHASKFLDKGQLSESSLGLSLCWTGHSEGLPLVAASDSAGHISVFTIGDCISKVSSWQAHDYEAWITAFHKFDCNVIYSGGDDCKLKSWDLRDTSKPTFCSGKHQMGVCSIQSHPFNEHLFASGSYDEELLIWDLRKLKQPLSSSSLGGGVWRIKWDPFSGSRILTATMYNGTHIVDCSDLGQNPLPIVAHYDDHNLAYGADWCRLSPDGSCREVVDSISASCDSHEKRAYFKQRRDGLEKTILEGMVPGRRGRGKPRRRGIQDINKTMNMSTTEVGKLARNGAGFRRAVKAATFCKGHMHT